MAVMSKMFRRILFLVVVSGLFLPCRAESQVDMLAGLWEITTEVEMGGTSVPMPAVTTRQCISPENVFPEINRFNASGQDCKITNVVIGKNFAAYDLACSMEAGEMKGRGSVTYKGQRLKGSLDTVMTPGNIQMTYTYTGRYIGPCR